jgi:serine/threonine protein kinase
MLDADGNLVLIDFGTAQVYKRTEKNKDRYERIMHIMSRFNQPQEEEEEYDEKEAISRERGKSFVGTALYASPEMIRKGYSGFESDYWSLGIMVYRMVFGKVPFKDE